MAERFGVRLRACRREKGMTQQELADAIGVSNKTISRWESDGGYPDVPLLVPLARALGTTVDGLLDEEGPAVRPLTRADWQGMLSFAFGLGGGVLYFLLDSFMPSLLCYGVYLGCLAYGTYLQRNYARHSRWFLVGTAGLTLSVHLSLLISAALAWKLLAVVGTGKQILTVLEQEATLSRLFTLPVGVVAAVGVALTAVVQVLVWRYLKGKKGKFSCPFRIAVKLPAPVRLLPALIPLLLAGYWQYYRSGTLSPEQYTRQNQWFWLALAILTALGTALLWRFGKRKRDVPALWMMNLLCGTMALWKGEPQWAYNTVHGNLVAYREGLAPIYTALEQPSPLIWTASAVLAALWVLTLCLNLHKKEDT